MLIRVRVLVTTLAVMAGLSVTAVAGAQTACDDLGGTVGPDQVCHVINTAVEPSYQYEFSFSVDYPDQQPVADYLMHERDEFVDYVKTLTRPNDIPYELDAKGHTYRSGSPPSGTASLVFKVYSETGGAHPVTYFDAFNYDRAKNVPITFDTLFKPDTKPLDVIYPIVARELNKRFGPEEIYGGHDVKTYKAFVITDDAVIFFFGQGQVLAQVDGPIEVTVPRTELAPLLA
ncbi:MAG: hypothetical protein QOH57_5430 [Mycobacterium sp.]|nr:hypothetical protein [Mycobacterium sp.]